MLRIILLLPLIALVLLNPGIEEFRVETKRRTTEEQSRLRAGWSSVSSAIGLNAISGAMGIGNYAICRKNFYLFSLFSVRKSKLLDSSTPVAVGLGVARYFTIASKNHGKKNSSLVSSTLAPYLIQWGSSLSYQECLTVHGR